MIDLITGHQGVPHISAEQVSTIQNALMYGYGQDQIVRIKDGGISKDGLEILIAAGYWRANGHDIQITEDDSVILDPTSEDMSRIDVVYAELLQDIPSGVQRVELVVVQGTEAETPTEPPVPVAPQLTTDLLLLAVPVVKATVTEGAMTIVDQTLPLTGGSGSSAMYGECNTSSSVSTKVVTTEGGDFALEAGNHVFVKFSSGNSVTSPTLQVDDCPAKTIVGYVLVRPEIWWKGYEVVEFVYDGSYFIMLPTSGQIETLLHGLTNYVIYGSTNDTGSTILEGQFFYKGNILARAKSQILNNEALVADTNYELVLWGGLNELSMQLYNATRTISRYGSCSTGASTTAKTVSTDTGDFSLRSGNRIYVKFTYTNTATSPTLNVDDTGAKSIKGYNSTKPDIWWNAGDVVEFVYNGTNYIMMPTQGQISTLNAALSNKQNLIEVQTLTSGGGTGIALQEGHYIKIGNLVMFELLVVISTNASISSKITTLPATDLSDNYATFLGAKAGTGNTTDAYAFRITNGGLYPNRIPANDSYIYVHGVYHSAS